MSDNDVYFSFHKWLFYLPIISTHGLVSTVEGIGTTQGSSVVILN